MIKLSTHGIGRLKIHEGCVLQVYRCTAGYQTFGYGHNIDANPLGPRQTELMRTNPEKLASDLLAEDIGIYELCITNKLPWVAGLCQPRIDANINLAFNMGCAGWCDGWPNTISMIRAVDYKGAADAIRNSRYRHQVGNRALEIANQIETGCYQNDHILCDGDSPSLKDVQVALNKHKAAPPLVVDGIMGPMTRQAITELQVANDLSVTGTVNDETLSLLGLA